MVSGFVKFLGGRVGEEDRVLLLLTMGFFMGIFLATLQVPAETLITALGDEGLDKAFFVGGSLGVLSALFYVYIQRQISFSALAIINTGIIALFMLGLRISFYYLEHDEASFVLFVVMGPLTSITILSFWGIFGRIFDVRASKRIVGGIDTGQLSATFLAFFMISFLSDYMSTLSILWISVASSFGVFIMTIRIVSIYKLDQSIGNQLATVGDKKVDQQRNKVSYLDLFRNKYFLMLSMFLVFSVCASKFNEFTYRSAMFAWHSGDEAALNRTYSIIDAIIIVVSFLVQSFLNDYIIGKYGLKISLMIMPILLGLFTIGAIVSAHVFGYDPSMNDYFIFFSFNVMGRILTAALRDALENPAFKMFFFPVNERDRFDVQSRIEGVVNSFAALVVGVVLIALGTIQYFEIVHFSYILLIMIVGAVIMAGLLFDEYKVTLKKSLLEQKERLHGGALQMRNDIWSAIKRGLSSAHSSTVIYTFKLLEYIDPFALRKYLVQALGSSSPSVKAYAYKKCVEVNNIEYLYDIQKASREERDLKLTQLAQEAAVQLTRSKSERASVAKLSKMFRDQDPSVRMRTAQILGSLPGNKHTVMLVELMQDPHPMVRRAAIVSAGMLKAPELWSTIIMSMPLAAYMNTSAAALVASGRAVFQTVDMLFYRTNQRHSIMFKVIQILGRLGGNEGMERIWKKIDYPNKHIFQECIRAMSTNAYRTQGLRSSRLKIQIEEDIGNIAWNINLLIHIPRKHTVDILISDAIEEENKQHQNAIFRVMSMVYDPQSIQLVKENVDFGTPESLTYAIELLDTFLDELIKPKVFPLLDDLQPDERVAKLSNYYAPEKFRGYEDVLHQIINRDYNSMGRWARSLAIYRLSSLSKAKITPDLIANVFNPDKYLLEVTAFVILQKDREEYRRQTRRIDSKLAKQLDTLLLPPAHLSEGANWQRSLLDLEIAIFLRNVPLFGDLPGDLLVELAQISTERRYKADQLIIRKGDEGTHPLRIVMRGMVNQHEHDQVTAQFSRADVIGFHQVSQKDRYMHDYTTIEPSTCIEIPFSELFMLMGMRVQLVEAMVGYLNKTSKSKNTRALQMESA